MLVCTVSTRPTAAFGARSHHVTLNADQFPSCTSAAASFLYHATSAAASELLLLLQLFAGDSYSQIDVLPGVNSVLISWRVLAEYSRTCVLDSRYTSLVVKPC